MMNPLERPTHGSETTPIPMIRARATWVTDTGERPVLTASLLGTFTCIVDGTEITGDPSKSGLRILKYLLITPSRKASRDVLLDTLWPDEDPKHARSLLRAELRALRTKTGGDAPFRLMQRNDRWYRINLGVDIVLDTDAFEAAVADGRKAERNGSPTAALAHYLRAMGLYGGDFLTDDPFEDWTVLPRSSYRITYLQILHRATTLVRKHGSPEDCVKVAQLILGQNPCSEMAHRLAMHSYAKLGQYRELVRQYDTCRLALRQALDIEPSQQTMEAYAAAIELLHAS